jgi:hypothetical protein
LLPQVSSGSYFGEEIKVAVLRTEFDKAVFLVDNLVCPRPFDWKQPKLLKDTDCLPCNYAVKDKKVCGTSRLKKENEEGGSSSKCKSECDEDKVKLLCSGSTRKEWTNNAGTHVESKGDFKEEKDKRKKVGREGGGSDTHYDFHNSTHFGSFPSPNDWTVVIAGVEIEDRIAETGKSHYFRYYHSDPEVGFRVEVRTKYGSTNL